MRKGFSVLIGLVLTLAMVLSILTACPAPPTPTPTKPTATTPGVSPTATTPGKPTETTPAPTPSKAGEVIRWRWQSGSTAGQPMWWIQQQFAENVKIASGGRFLLELLPVGSIINAAEFVDAVSAGSIEMCGPIADVNFSGKDSRFDLLGCIVGHFTPTVHLYWFYYSTPEGPGKGWKYAEELYSKFNIKWLPFGTFVAEAEYMANKPLLKPADFKGLTFRGTGWTQLTVQEPSFGAKGVFVPATDVYSALQTGVIDACELGNVFSNYKQGYYDITKYTGFPGIHKLSESASLMIPMATWKKLPVDLQKILEVTATNYTIRQMAYQTVESAMVIPVIIKQGVTVTYESSEVQEMWRATSWMLAEKEAAKSADFKKWWEEMKAWQITMDRYNDLQTPRYGPAYEGNKEKIPGIKF